MSSMTAGMLGDLYQEVILDHNRSPRNRGELASPSHSAKGHNPLCGDRVEVFLRVDNDRVEEISFQGAGCAICTASCSLMTEAVKGRSVAEARAMFAGFHGLVTGQDGDDGVELGKLRVLEGVRQYPMRVKCATLAWHTLDAALTDRQAPVTTEA